MEYAIEVKNVKKSFGGVKALKNVSFKVRKGSIHALIGENGAGKSTLMKIVSGIHLKDGGDIIINGTKVDFNSPKDSLNFGVGIIHQELALAPDLTVAENIFLSNLGFGSFFVNKNKMNKRAKEALDQLGFNIDPNQRVGSLSLAYQQMVEIAKAIAKQVSILILDEPTAVLSDREIDILFSQLDILRKNGTTIIYISHRLEEIFRISDSITVIKDGETIIDLDPKVCTENDIISNMVGRKVESLFPEKVDVEEKLTPVLEIKNLYTPSLLQDVNIKVNKGEIVGLAGLVGAGRTEVARCVFGIDKIQSGKIFKDGHLIHINHPASAMKHGIGMIPESRKEQGAILTRPIYENITLSALKSVSNFSFISRKEEESLTDRLRKSLKIKMGRSDDPISSLSGGNQQKVVIGKWLCTQCNMLIMDEPTRGVDVGAKSEIYEVINDLVKLGFSILVISSELPEIIGLCHRTYVMSEGTIAGELIGSEMTEENIMRLSIPKRG